MLKSSQSFVLFVAAGALLAVATPAEAGVGGVGSQAAFNALGTVAQNTNFDALGTGWTYINSPYTVGDLTFVAGVQSIVGGIDSYGAARALFTDDYIAGTTVQVAGSHDLFAFNAGNFYGAGPSSITVTTNLASYSFSLGVAGVQGPLTFLGFEAGAGEDITSVWFGGGYAIGGTDFQVGNKGQDVGPRAVPEPASWALMLGGFGLVGSALRRRRTAISFA